MKLKTFRWLDDSSIGTRLGTGFGLLLLLLIGYGLFSVGEIATISALGTSLHDHPMTSGEAVRDANIAILKMHRAMLQIPRASDAQLEVLERVVADNLAVVQARFRVIEDRFLGDKATVLALEKGVADWAPIRAEVIRLRHLGKLDQSTRTTAVIGAGQVALIEEEMDAMTAFSSGKAAEFIGDMNRTQDKLRLITWLLLALSVAFSALVALVITRSIRRPVVALSGAASKVAEGDYTQYVDFAARSELGTQTRVFNMMVKAIREQTEIIKQKNEENERLLLNILPAPIAGRLKSGARTIADAYGEVTVLFADIVGFTKFSSSLPGPELVEMLNELFSAFDAAAAREGVEKIKTIGDAYMAVAGLPSMCADHTEKIFRLAGGMMGAIEAFNRHRGTQLSLRIGINRGPVVAGVIGTHKFIYDLWGDTVNIASRMESTGVPGRIQVTEAAYEYMKDQCEFEPRGEVAVKGKGMMPVFLLKPEAAIPLA